MGGGRTRAAVELSDGRCGWGAAGPDAVFGEVDQPTRFSMLRISDHSQGSAPILPQVLHRRRSTTGGLSAAHLEDYCRAREPHDSDFMSESSLSVC